MTRVRFAAVLAGLALAAGCGSIEKPLCALPKPEAAPLQAMLREHRFAELDEAIRTYQEAAERDPACEARAWTAFRSTRRGPEWTRLRSHLDAFVAAQSESFVPYAVRGDWWLRIGLERRGRDVIARTSRGQLESMRDALRKAAPDLERAIALRPTVSVAHGSLIELFRTSGREDELYAAYDRAVAAVPRSHLVRERMVDARAPKWGGSRKEQGWLALDAWRRRAENARMWFVVGGVFVSLGDDVFHRNHRLGIFFYDLALRCDDAVGWYERRAKARDYVGDEEGAAADAREILAREPRHEYAWDLLVWQFQKRNDWEGALGVLDERLAVEPDSIRLLQRRAFTNSKARRMGAAEADYQRLLELERSSQHFQAYSRFLVEEKRGDYERAVAVMRQAVREDPLDADNWSHLGAAQYMTGDPAAKQSFERFLALVDTSVPENADRARWIRSYLARGTPARKPHGRARAAADGASSP